jgi:hypothetical protein
LLCLAPALYAGVFDYVFYPPKADYAGVVFHPKNLPVVATDFLQKLFQ